MDQSQFRDAAHSAIDDSMFIIPFKARILVSHEAGSWSDQFI